MLIQGEVNMRLKRWEINSASQNRVAYLLEDVKLMSLGDWMFLCQLFLWWHFSHSLSFCVSKWQVGALANQKQVRSACASGQYTISGECCIQCQPGEGVVKPCGVTQTVCEPCSDSKQQNQLTGGGAGEGVAWLSCPDAQFMMHAWMNGWTQKSTCLSAGLHTVRPRLHRFPRF